MNGRESKNDVSLVLANLPSGKRAKSGEREPMAGQTGVTCKLSALRRISFFNADVKSDPVYKIVKAFKKQLETVNSLESIREWLVKNARPYLPEVQTSTDLNTLYNALLKKYYPLCRVGETYWTPEDGPEMFIDLIRATGAQLVVGKFGGCMHLPGSLITFSQFDKESRKYYGFKKHSYAGNFSQFTHTVLVDEVKLINSEYYVVFRNPADASIPGQDEKVYLLKYTNFIARLSTLDSKDHSSEKVYTLCSLFPDRLANKKEAPRDEAPMEKEKQPEISATTISSI